MIWIAAAVFGVTAIVVMVGVLTSRSTADLGTVSSRWIADHRIDAS